MMTAREQVRSLGQSTTGLLASDGMRFPVTIHDTREVWGRLDYLVAPVNGEGCKWVSADRVRIVAPETAPSR